MTAENAQDFYDDFSDDYQLIYPDWQESTQRQGGEISRLIGRLKGPDVDSVLDCSCGIGTQAVGLALEGFTVRATDISPKAVARAAASAAAMGAEVTFGTADFRYLDQQVDGSFDVVLSFENSVAHMLTDEDLAMAFAAMKAKLAPGGLLLVSVRDYGAYWRERRPGTIPRTMDLGGRKRVYFQTWEWQSDAPVYTSEFFVLKQTDHGWDVKSGRTTLRALAKEALLDLLKEAGYQDIAWHPPTDSGYHQPVISARNN